MAVAGSNAGDTDGGVLARAQMTMTTMNPTNRVACFEQDELRKNGAQTVAAVLPTMKPMKPSPMACCRIIPAIVRLRVPISFSTGYLPYLAQRHGVDNERQRWRR